jgi:hypothetical protein
MRVFAAFTPNPMKKVNSRGSMPTGNQLKSLLSDLCCSHSFDERIYVINNTIFDAASSDDDESGC